MNKQSSAVLRDGKGNRSRCCQELVVEMFLVLEAGSMITADARLIRASSNARRRVSTNR